MWTTLDRRLPALPPVVVVACLWATVAIVHYYVRSNRQIVASVDRRNHLVFTTVCDAVLCALTCYSVFALVYSDCVESLHWWFLVVSVFTSIVFVAIVPRLHHSNLLICVILIACLALVVIGHIASLRGDETCDHALLTIVRSYYAIEITIFLAVGASALCSLCLRAICCCDCFSGDEPISILLR